MSSVTRVGVARSAALATIAAGGVWLLPAAPACACSCVGVRGAELVASVDTIITGEVVARNDPGGLMLNSARPITYTVEVSEVHKGTAHATTYVRSAAEEASCGAPLTVGQTLTIFARTESDGAMQTSLCDMLFADSVTADMLASAGEGGPAAGDPTTPTGAGPAPDDGAATPETGAGDPMAGAGLGDPLAGEGPGEPPATIFGFSGYDLAAIGLGGGLLALAGVAGIRWRGRRRRIGEPG